MTSAHLIAVDLDTIDNLRPVPQGSRLKRALEVTGFITGVRWVGTRGPWKEAPLAIAANFRTHPDPRETKVNRMHKTLAIVGTPQYGRIGKRD